MHTHEDNYKRIDLLQSNKSKRERVTDDIAQVPNLEYKGIYYDEEVGENEKNHCEITGAHFKYHDACKKLLDYANQK